MNGKIKILHAIRQGKIGGGESHVIDLVENLDPARFESVVLSFTDGPMIERMKQLGIKTFIIHTEKPFDRGVRGKVKEILEKEQIDIVHAHGTRANSNTYYAAKILNIPLIYTVHGWSFHSDQVYLLRKLRIWSERFLVKKADFTICVSESNFNDGKALFPLGKSKVIRPGINLDKFNPDKKYADFKNVNRLDEEVVIVGYLVRMTKQKDPLTLVRAISLIPDEIKVVFLFVGDGDLREEAEKLARKLHTEAKIRFLGFRQDVPAILNAIDVYCLPSLWEGLPIGILEAMAMSKAVIATGVDGTKEVITDGQNGILVAVQSPHELAEKLLKLIQDAGLRSTLGKQAREDIRSGYSVESMTRQVEEVYTSFRLT